ncbi:MAG TPA: hypothetical protein VHN80_32710, partial [Kineosporiaceae bacterium]|nr:hypothetical protein [Kineosporiaceae bacterium]
PLLPDHGHRIPVAPAAHRRGHDALCAAQVERGGKPRVRRRSWSAGGRDPRSPRSDTHRGRPQTPPGRARRRYPVLVMNSVNAPQSHELIVGPDGSIPADQIARLGLRPGTHLRVVAEPGLGADDPARTSLAGALRERIDDAALDRFDAALAANRRERIAAVEPA